MIFTMSIVLIVTNIVQEKENGIKDGLLMAGVHPIVFWLSWLIIYFVIIFVTCVMIVGIFYFTKTFSNCNIIILFLSIFLYGISCCTISFALSTLFKKTKTAGTIIGFISLAFSFTNILSGMVSLSIKKIISCLISPIAIGSFIYEVNDMEDKFTYLSFNNIIKTNAGFFILSLIICNILISYWLLLWIMFSPMKLPVTFSPVKEILINSMEKIKLPMNKIYKKILMLRMEKNV